MKKLSVNKRNFLEETKQLSASEDLKEVPKEEHKEVIKEDPKEVVQRRNIKCPK